MADAPKPQITINSASAIGSTPKGIRQTVRRVVATHPYYPWYQQCLTFEIIENISLTNGGGGGRAVRISTDGTALNTALYRSAGSPFVAQHLVQDIGTQIQIMQGKTLVGIDNKKILDAFGITIQSTNPDMPAGQINGAKDWMAVDISPRSQNNTTEITTSTSMGINAGMFGDTPTVGFNQDESSSRNWSLPDYKILAVLGTVNSNEHHASWRMERSEKTTDPDLAFSSICPKFEAVFCLRPEAQKQRYSAISVLSNAIFMKDETKVEEKKNHTSKGILEVLVSTISEETPGKLLIDFDTFPSEIKKAAKNFKYTDYRDTKHSFISTFIIDWDDGFVFPFIPQKAIPDSSKPLPPGFEHVDLPVTIPVSDADRRAAALNWLVPLVDENDVKVIDAATKNSGINLYRLEAKDAASILSPSCPSFERSKKISFSLREGSNIGFAVDPSNAPYVEGKVEDYGMGFFANGYRVATGFTELFSPKTADTNPQAVDIPFKNSVRITKPKEGVSAYWLLPNNFRSDFMVVGETLGSVPDPAKIEQNLFESMGVPECPDSISMVQKVEHGEFIPYILYRDFVFEYDQNRVFHRAYKTGIRNVRSAIFHREHSLAISDGRLLHSQDLLESFDADLSDIECDLHFSGTYIGAPNFNTLGDFLKKTSAARIFSSGHSDPNEEDIMIIADDLCLSFKRGQLDLSIENRKRKMTAFIFNMLNPDADNRDATSTHTDKKVVQTLIAYHRFVTGDARFGNPSSSGKGRRKIISFVNFTVSAQEKAFMIFSRPYD